MEQKKFVFNISPCRTDAYMPQVSRALEKRTELVSRAQHPELWSKTDKINAMTHGTSRNKGRTKVVSVLWIALGIFPFVPGLIKPQELLIPMIAGGVAIIMGISGLWRNRKNKTSPFEQAAKNLLDARSMLENGKIQISFSSDNMEIAEQVKDQTESIPYFSFEYIIETQDVFLLIFDNRAVILLKQELSNGKPDEFCGFISAAIPNYVKL